jgi:cytochrome oxidase assembly protein ShyY1
VYRFLLRPRWIALTVLMLAMTPACVALGQWQLHRYHERHDANTLVHRNLSASPVPVGELTAPTQDLDRRDIWRAVTATGRFDTRHQLLVRNRTQQGRAGLYVLTPLVTADGSAVVVNRGWVPPGPTAADLPPVPPPPTGTVTVRGRIRPPETLASSGIRDRAGAPAGEIYRIDTALIRQRLPYPLDRAYVEQTEGQGPAGPAAVPPPADQDEGMNLSYVVQWNLFAVIAVLTWGVLVGRETRRRRREAGAPGEEGQARWPAESKTMR